MYFSQKWSYLFFLGILEMLEIHKIRLSGKLLYLFKEES